jgi:hypothetical protein
MQPIMIGQTLLVSKRVLGKVTFLPYLLSIYGISYLIAVHEDWSWVRIYILIFLSSIPKFPDKGIELVSKALSCQACTSFWTGLLVAPFFWGFMAPLYAFACFGFVTLIGQLKPTQYTEST